MKNEPKQSGITIVEIPQEKYGLLTRETVNEIVGVALSAFGSGMTGREVTDHVFPTDRAYLAYTQEGLVGFATAEIRDKSVYLAGAAIKSTHQGTGVYKEFALRRVNLALDLGKEMVETRTQNPRIECGIRACLERFRGIGVIKSFSIERETCPGIYGRMLTAERPFSDVEEVNQFYATLDYERGDAYLLRFLLKSGR